MILLLVLCLLLSSGAHNVVKATTCIRTLNDFQQSLVSRTVNLDSLNLAFSPPNHQSSISFVVHYYFCTRTKTYPNTSKILCSDIEAWANDINSGRHPSEDFKDRYVYKFIWNASPINLFIRPELLASLSLFTFRIQRRNTTIILDEICSDVIKWFDPMSMNLPTALSDNGTDDPLHICRHPTPVLTLLESLTDDLKSFYLHKISFFTHGIKAPDGSEQGYPTYYFNPYHKDDVCVLRQVEAYERNRYILAVAILLTQLLIPFVIPFATRLFYDQVFSQIKRKESNLKHYFFGFVLTSMLLMMFAFAANFAAVVTEEANGSSQSGVTDVRNYYIAGSVILFVVNPALAIANIWYNFTLRKNRKCCHCYQCSDFFLVLSIATLNFTLNLLSFNIVYIFMGLIAAPIETGSLLFLYSTVFFLLTMFFALMSKGYEIARANMPSREKLNVIFVTEPNIQQDSDAGSFVGVSLPLLPHPKRSRWCRHALVVTEPANVDEFVTIDRSPINPPPLPPDRSESWHFVFLVIDFMIAILIAILVLGDMLLYLAFYYEMAVTIEPYSSSAGFLSSFGSLIPAIFTLTAGILEKRLINFLSSSVSSKKHPNKDSNHSYYGSRRRATSSQNSSNEHSTLPVLQQRTRAVSTNSTQNDYGAMN